MKNGLIAYNRAMMKLMGNDDMKENSGIAKAFVAAQKAFNPALKSSVNPHFKSKYVGLDGCVEAVIDALNDNGIALIQETSECENGVIVETVFMHESGEIMKCGKLHVPASKNDAQGYGSALTYARRYSLMAACGIAPEDDDGNAASKGKGDAVAKAVAEITADQKTVLMDMIKEAGMTEAQFLEWGKIDSIDDMPANKYHKALAALEKHIHDKKGK